MSVGLKLLGPPRVTTTAAELPPGLNWKKPLALVIHLALAPRQARPREQLVGMFWGDTEEGAARHSLNEALRLVRKGLGPDAILTEGDLIRLAPGAVTLDLDELDRAVDAGTWEVAAGLIDGDLAEGFTVPGAAGFDDWLQGERLRRRPRLLAALLGAGEARFRAGDATGALTLAEQALALDPASERGAALAIRALAVDGGPGQAAARFARFRAAVEELTGTAPSPELTALVERVRHRRPLPGCASPAMALRRAPLVGRSEELATLTGLFSAAVAEGGLRIGIILGESGAGKSRLLDEVLARAELDGAATLLVRAVPGDRDDLRASVKGLLAAGLLELRGVRGAAPEALATATREAEAGAVTELLRAAAEERPLVVAWDAAEQFAPESLEAIALLARGLAGRPALLLVAAATWPERPALDALRAQVGRDLPGSTVRLGPLDAGGIAWLVHWGFPAWEEGAIARLARRVEFDSAGWPLLAVELIGAVAAGLELGEGKPWPAPSRTLTQTTPGELPDVVVAAVRVGFRRLSTAAQELLAAGAILGDRFTVAEVAAALAHPAEALLPALDELEWTRWLVADPRGYTFVARLVREIVARDMLTSGQRQRIAARVAPGRDP